MEHLSDTNTLTVIRPLVDRVDQLFSVVESLRGDLAKERASSRLQHDETFMRLNNLDKATSQHLAEFMKACEDQLNQTLEDVVEQRLEEQHCRLTAWVGDLRQEFGELLFLLTEGKGPLAKLFEQVSEVKHAMSRIGERLDASVCDWQRHADALRQEFHSNAESLNRATQSAADELGIDLHSNAEHVRVDAMRKTVGAVQPALHEVTQEQFDTFDRRLRALEEDTRSMNRVGTNTCDTQSVAGALQLSLQRNADAVQEMAVTLSKTNLHISKEAATAKAMRESIENMNRAVHEVSLRLAASDGHHAQEPVQHGPDARNLAVADTTIKLSGKAAASHHACRIRRLSGPRSPADSVRILTMGSSGSLQAVSNPALGIGEAMPRQQSGTIVPNMSISSPRPLNITVRIPSPRGQDVCSTIPFQGVPFQSRVLTQVRSTMT